MANVLKRGFCCFMQKACQSGMAFALNWDESGAKAT